MKYRVKRMPDGVWHVIDARTEEPVQQLICWPDRQVPQGPLRFERRVDATDWIAAQADA